VPLFSQMLVVRSLQHAHVAGWALLRVCIVCMAVCFASQALSSHIACCLLFQKIVSDPHSCIFPHLVLNLCRAHRRSACKARSPCCLPPRVSSNCSGMMRRDSWRRTTQCRSVCLCVCSECSGKQSAGLCAV
jgi:hypothetical protein